MINRFALNLWGYSREELLGGNLSILIDKPYSTRIIKYSKDKKLSEKLNLLNKDIRIKGIKKNKKRFPVSLNFVENKIQDNQFFTVAITDLTELLKNKQIQTCMLEISNSVRISTNIKQLYREIYKNLNLLIPIEQFTISLIENKNKIQEYNYTNENHDFETTDSIKLNIFNFIFNKV